MAAGVAVIRQNEPERYIVIGSNRWQSVHTFDEMRLPEQDSNIILSFHFYLPFPLTRKIHKEFSARRADELQNFAIVRVNPDTNV